MKQNKLILYILIALVLIKFVYVPWSTWLDEKQASNERLSNYLSKQQQAISNEATLADRLNEHQKELEQFTNKLTTLTNNQKPNALWFSVVESIKSKGVKVYNQKVEFEQVVTNSLGYVTGSLSITGKARDVSIALAELETKTPIVFIEQLSISRPNGGKKENLVVQLYLGYWYAHRAEV